MKRKLIIATLLLCMCLPMFLSGCLALATYSLAIEYSTYELAQDFENIKINTTTANVTFRHSSGNGSKIFCEEIKGQKHEVEVVDNTLVISQPQSDKWYANVLRHTNSFIVVYLDKLNYDSLNFNGKNASVNIQKGHSFKNVEITLDVGDIKWTADVTENFSATLTNGDTKLEDSNFNSITINNHIGDVQLLNCNSSASTLIDVAAGDLTLYKAELHSLNAKIVTGYATCNEVLTAGKLSIQVTTGNIALHSSDASSVEIITQKGDITASFLSGKNIVAQTDSGNINLPESSVGGACSLKTNAGDITVEIIPLPPKSDAN